MTAPWHCFLYLVHSSQQLIIYTHYPFNNELSPSRGGACSFLRTHTHIDIKCSVNIEVLTTLCQSQHTLIHTEGVAVMKYPFLLVFAPVRLIQSNRIVCVCVCVHMTFVSFRILSLKLFFFSFLLNPYSSIYLEDSGTVILKAHTSLLLTNWASLAVVSLLTAGQNTHTYTQMHTHTYTRC